MARIAFLDFEASSLAKDSYPIEVAWVFDTGASESHLIRPAPGWTDWDERAQRIHGLTREDLLRDGTPHDRLARRMIDLLDGVALYATAPSWDGKWLSRLLRGAGLPRHALRLRDADEAHRRLIAAELALMGLPPETRGGVVEKIFAAGRRTIEREGPAVHRALADARREFELWSEVGRLARNWSADGSAAATGSP